MITPTKTVCYVEIYQLSGLFKVDAFSMALISLDGWPHFTTVGEVERIVVKEELL